MNNKLNEDELDGIIYEYPYLKFRKITNELDTIMYKFNHVWFVDITSKIMDIYMIRLILNNDMNNIITYNGIEHTMYLIYILVKYSNFKVTNSPASGAYHNQSVPPQVDPFHRRLSYRDCKVTS